jgi:tripeptidyl-peptidase II
MTVLTRLPSAAIALGLLLFPAVADDGADAPAEQAAASQFPYLGLLPKSETGALAFLAEHPEFDGRGITVAIFDTGVDPGAPGLEVTSDGRPKVVDLVDATGDGDVSMSKPQKPEEGRLSGLSGRELTIDPDWTNPSGEYRLGFKRGYELFPSDLVSRLEQERHRDWERRQQQRAAMLRQDVLEWDAEHPSPTPDQLLHRKELEARGQVLQSARDGYEDPGPIYDCVTFHDGERWHAVIDTDEDGDLRDEQRLTDFCHQRQYASFGAQSQLNFSVNIYDDGKLLSIVTVCGDHGTHVAGIVGACFPDDPVRNGVAPGVQIVSVKIGDTRLDGMETGPALVRGLQTVLQRKCDLINMSYGEPSSTPNRGRLIELFSEVVREHGVIFVSSAGNEGPALSTVGAPGGSTDAILGIGAYVSPEMMTAEYAIRQDLPGMPYTWTSRGPTLDGARGVDLFAPGGAIAPVPNYNLQPSVQMNGTSMASPNACGNIALLLSALKAREQPYTPALVRRALQNTARRLPDVDEFAQGAGLVQVESAYEWLTAAESTQPEQLSYAVEVGRDEARGILLRELDELQRPLTTQVSVRPRFREQADKQQLVDFEVPLLLRADRDWVETGDALLLTAGGNSFELFVDPTSLPPGIHSASVQAFEAERPERGPLFEVPVTVIKPPPPQPECAATADLTAGSVVRGLASVPAGASWVDVHVQLTEADGPRRLLLHAVQLLPGQTFEEGQSKQSINVEPGSEYVHSLPVVAGRTLEVVLAQYWESLGQTQVEWSLRFRGLQPDDDEVVLPSDGSLTLVNVQSQIRRERCAPSGSLTTHRQLLRPTKIRREPLTSARDRLPDGTPTQRLLLTYEVTQPKEGSTTIRVPQFDGLLYDSPLEGHQWRLTDENGRLIRTDDLYPEEFTLKEGTFELLLALRIADADTLEQLEGTVVAVDRELSRSIDITPWAGRAAAAARSSRFQATWLEPDEMATLWIAGPTDKQLPSDAQPGDLLLGQMTFAESPEGLAGGRSRPGGYPLRFVFPPAKSASQTAPQPKTPDVKPLAQRLAEQRRELALKQLIQLKWPADRELFDTLAAPLLEDGDPSVRRQVLVAKLHLLDNDDREERLGEVVVAADAVLATINTRRLRNRLAAKPGADDPEAQARLKDAETLNGILVDTLYRKGRALGYHELPDVIEKHPIEDQEQLDRDFEANFEQLAQWVDTTQSDYVLLHIRRDRRKERYGTALEQLNKQIDDTVPARELLHKKRRDLYEHLGWDDWRDYEQAWMLIRFPEVEPVF